MAKPKKDDTTNPDALSSTSSKVIELPTIVRVCRTVKIDGEDEASDLDTEDVIEVHRFVTQPAVVRFGFPIKRAVEFQSVGLDISVELPCYVEEIEAGFEHAKEIVVGCLQKHITEMNSVLDHLVDLKHKAEGR